VKDPGTRRTAPPPSQVRAMFDGIVRRYDLSNRLLSMGLDRRWRRAAVGFLDPSPDDVVLDVGTGTGDIAKLAARRAAVTVGVDVSHGMLVAASAKLGPQATLVEGSIFALPFRDDAFSAAVSAFVLRNLDDLAAAFRELARVVRPGGRIALVDITEPRNRLLRGAFDRYFAVAAPMMGRLLGTADAYRYLARSLAQLPPPEEVCGLLGAAGFEDARARALTGGMVTLFTATRSMQNPRGDESG
jgi:demethylmenaquinone methyltransferase / 2-methoxy-6-polyprenyl-1,4-benzoquinol methylase